MMKSKLLQYRWIILGITWTSTLTVYVMRFGVGPLAPFLKEALNLTNAQVGSLVSATAIFHGPTLIIAGWLTDCFGVRRILVIGTGIVSFCLFTLFFAPSYYSMLIVLMLSGLGTGCIFPSSVKAIMMWFSYKERATVLGLNQTAINVSGIIGAGLLPTIAITLGWRYAFLFVSIGAMVFCLCCATLYQDPYEEAGQLRGAHKQLGKIAKPLAIGLGANLFKSRDIWMLGLSGLFIAIIEFATVTYLVLYLKENLLFDVVAAGGLLAMTEAAGAIGKPVSGLISDRIFQGRRKTVFILMGGISGITCLVLSLGGPYLGWIIYPVLFTLGAVSIGWGGLYATISGELGGKELAGVATGASSAILVIGVIIGPPLFGFIVDRTGSFQIAWSVMAVSGLLSLLFASFIREHERQI